MQPTRQSEGTAHKCSVQIHHESTWAELCLYIRGNIWVPMKMQSFYVDSKYFQNQLFSKEAALQQIMR